MEEERPFAPISVEDDPSVSKVLVGEGVGDAFVPTPAAKSDASKASPDDTDSTELLPAHDNDREDAGGPGHPGHPVELGTAGDTLPAENPGPPGRPEAAEHRPSLPVHPSHHMHPSQPVHVRQGSRHHHSRNPSDVCPRVAVIATQEEEENVCSICLDEFCDEDPIAETQCGHGYHLQCIMQWAQRSQECPLCFSQLMLVDEDMNGLLPFGEYSSPQEEQAMSNMLANIEFETFLVHLAAAERRQARQQRRENRRRASEDGGHVVMTGSGSAEEESTVGSPSESMLKSVRRGFASFFLGK